MRRRSLGIALGAALLSVALARATSVAADIPPPPDPPEGKRVPATIEVDWGVFADRVSTKHVVAAGETLRAIATKELGDAAHWKAIADANPDVAANPDKIAAGATLWLPSKASLAKDTGTEKQPASASLLSTWYDAFW